ncbi:MAG TPA: MFS transporter [Thermomicrobiales bacterium]|nr:MFS transporter [Thermomicrobiales bacterium]
MAGMGAAAGVRGASGARRGRFAALRSRNFAILWCAGIVSNAGAQMQDVAKIWLIVQRTNSAVALALLGLCFAVPMTLLPPIGGALADRVDRVTVLKGTQSLMTLQPLLLAGLLATGHAPLWVLYADTVVAAAVYAANSPAQQALLPALVPREDLLNATALQSSVWTGARLVGPALGGLLLIPLGAAWLFAVNGLSTLFVLAALFGLRGVPGCERAAPGAPAHGGSGLRYVLAHRPVLAILALTAGLTVLQGAYAVLLPFFARDVWHAGALLGTFGLAALGDVRRKGLAAGGGALLYCGALFLFAHAPIYTLGLALLVLATLLQLLVPGSLRGRVMALRSIAYIGLGDFGGLFSGGLAQLLGPAAALTCGAVALLALLPAVLRPLGAARPDAPEIAG